MNYDPSSSSSLFVVCEGDDLLDNAMNVRDLTQIMRATDDLVQIANELFNGSHAEAVLRTRALRPGSIEIAFSIDIVGIVALVVVAAPRLRDLLFGGADPGFLNLIKRIGSRKASRRESSASDRVLVEATGLTLFNVGTADSLQMSIPNEVWELYRNTDALTAASQFLSPLGREGVNRIGLRDETGEIGYFEKSDLPSFQSHSEDMESVESVTHRQLLTLITPHLDYRDRQWRLHDGRRAGYYAMRDTAFLNQVRKGRVQFTAGDILDCEVKHIQYVVSVGEIRSYAEILTVWNHLSREQQESRWKR